MSNYICNNFLSALEATKFLFAICAWRCIYADRKTGSLPITLSLQLWPNIKRNIGGMKLFYYIYEKHEGNIYSIAEVDSTDLVSWGVRDFLASASFSCCCFCRAIAASRSAVEVWPRELTGFGVGVC